MANNVIIFIIWSIANAQQQKYEIKMVNINQKWKTSTIIGMQIEEIH